MNKVILIGRLTRDPEVNYGNGPEPVTVARYTLAVDRKVKQEGGQQADFISCTAFGKNADFAEKYLRKGIKIAITGRIQTGSYTNRDGVKVYTTNIVVESQEFVERKGTTEGENPHKDLTPSEVGDGFMNIPDGIEEELPFN